MRAAFRMACPLLLAMMVPGGIAIAQAPPPAQDQAPARTSAAPAIRPAQASPAQPAASPQSTVATERCVATADAADRSRTCEQMSKGNPAIVDPNPTKPPR